MKSAARIFEEYDNGTYEYEQHPDWSVTRAEAYASSAAWRSDFSGDDFVRAAVIDDDGRVTRVFDWKSWQHGRQPTDAERRHFESLAKGEGDPYFHPPIPSGYEKPEFHLEVLDPEGPYDIVEVAMTDANYEELVDRLRQVEEIQERDRTSWDTQRVIELKHSVDHLCEAVREALAWRLEETR